jgi:Meckel syndrome type 1 protein
MSATCRAFAESSAGYFHHAFSFAQRIPSEYAAPVNMRAFICIPLAILVSACSQEEMRGYPSLAKRPIENPVEPTNVQTVATASGGDISEGELAKQMADFSAQVQTGDRQFSTVYNQEAGRIRVAKSAPVLSEQWVMAQIALGKLEQARSTTMTALASLDALYANRLAAVADGKAQGGDEPIREALDQAMAVVDAQNAKVQDLQAALQAP